MRLLIILSLLVPALSGPAGGAQRRRALPKVEAPGSFVLAYADALKGFSDIRGLTLVTKESVVGRDGMVHEWTEVKPRGTLYAARAYPLTNVVDDGDRLAFETRRLRGVSYRFTGTWNNQARSGEPVLKGHLAKLRAGRAVAEADVQFFAEEGD